MKIQAEIVSDKKATEMAESVYFRLAKGNKGYILVGYIYDRAIFIRCPIITGVKK